MWKQMLAIGLAGGLTVPAGMALAANGDPAKDRDRVATLAREQIRDQAMIRDRLRLTRPRVMAPSRVTGRDQTRSVKLRSHRPAARSWCWSQSLWCSEPSRSIFAPHWGQRSSRHRTPCRCASLVSHLGQIQYPSGPSWCRSSAAVMVRLPMLRSLPAATPPA